MMKHIRYLWISVVILSGWGVFTSISAQESFHPLRSSYMGQEGNRNPEIFLPGKISTGYEEGCSLFFREARSFLWRTNRLGRYALLLLEDREDRWQPPQEVKFFPDDSQVWDFTIGPSGDQIYFTSNKKTTSHGSNIWRIRLISGKWQQPEILGNEVNSNWHDSYPSISREGELYFFRRNPENPNQCDLYRSNQRGEGFTRAIRMKKPVNSSSLEYDPFIGPDGSYLIFCSRRLGGRGKGDLYISFRNSAGNWDQPIHLGSDINSRGEENRPSVTIDGRYFFFTSTRLKEPKLPPGMPPAQSMPGKGSRDIYWLKADLIERLREKTTQ
jgi:hypothetical protein